MGRAMTAAADRADGLRLDLARAAPDPRSPINGRDKRGDSARADTEGQSGPFRKPADDEGADRLRARHQR